MAVSLGLSGALIAIAASFVVMLRTRQYRSGSEVLAGLTAGVLGLISTAAAALALHPDWRASIAVVLAAAGALVLTSSLDRKRVVSGKSVSVSVDLGGRRIIKKNNKQST